VDSAVTALLMRERGYRVVGMNLRLFTPSDPVHSVNPCCGIPAMDDARATCQVIGVPFYAINMEAEFGEAVINRFVDEYAAGRTPNPCLECNRHVKFRHLVHRAKLLGADCLATGHYVRRVVNDGRVELHKGADPRRDQSYFLYGTTREQLDFLRFPLGGLPKDDVRRIAADVGLEVAAKPDSQDICFVPDGDYAGLVKRLRPDTEAEGEIVDLSGRVLGRHRGVVHFTVGQRRGIEVGGQAEPLYVVRIDPAERRIVVGPRRALAVAAMRVEDWNWLGEAQREVAVKVRSLAPAVPATRNGEWVRFATAEYGVAPGQAAVAYAGSRMLGGGTIAATEAALLEAAA
jgi:tRNA-specific 2-thiouridylase